MEPSQVHNEENTSQNDHEERINRIDSDIKKQKEQLLKEFEESSNDSRKRRPKHSKSKANRLEIFQIETLPSEHRPFAPFVTNNTLQVLHLFETFGFFPEAIVYNEKHNLIMGCHCDGSMQFFDATTLLPSARIKGEKLETPATVISFWPETETYALGCFHGNVYTYNLSDGVIQKVQKVQNRNLISGVTFFDSKLLAYAADDSQKIEIKNLENGDITQFGLGNNSSYNLFCLPNKKLLFSSLKDGAVQIYRTDQVPRLPMISSIRGFGIDNSLLWRKVQSVTINRKDYMIIAGAEWKIRISYLSKGKMKLVKVIPVEETVLRMVYLENYKMLATTHNSQFIRFYSLPFGKLECTLDLGMEKCCNIFLMKDKNCLGVVPQKGDIIKMIQLH